MRMTRVLLAALLLSTSAGAYLSSKFPIPRLGKIMLIAGATLATTSIALKLSPKGQSTAYVATAGLATAVAAGLAPILGGAFESRLMNRIRKDLGLTYSINSGFDARREPGVRSACRDHVRGHHG